MVTSRHTFYGTLRAMLALCNEPLLTDSFPPTAPRNVDARLLRHGLAVTAFSSLEKYVGSRFVELFSRVEGGLLPYGAFTEELQCFLTRDAAAGLLNRVSFMEEGLKQSYFDANLPRVAGYLSTPVTYTAFGFSPRGSNVGHEDIKKAFSALGLKDAWGQLGRITSAIGSPRISLVDDYRNLSKTRHKSAHDPDSNVPSADLTTHIETAILIGIAVDALTSTIAEAYINAHSKEDLKTRLGSLVQAFRFVDQEASGSFVERSSINGRAIKRYADEAAAISGAMGRSVPAFVILRSSSTTPIALA